MKLSILICSLESRAELAAQLLAILNPQLTPDVELLMDVDRGEVSIGAKRNRLVQRATGEYVCFIDDDDKVADDYVSSILAALDEKPDCVGFHLMYYVDGMKRGTAIHSLRFQQYGQQRLDNWLMLYERTPNHLNPIRRDIVMRVPFPAKNRGEDTEFAVAIRPLLHTEAFIEKPLYRYFYRSNK